MHLLRESVTTTVTYFDCTLQESTRPHKRQQMTGANLVTNVVMIVQWVCEKSKERLSGEDGL